MADIAVSESGGDAISVSGFGNYHAAAADVLYLRQAQPSQSLLSFPTIDGKRLRRCATMPSSPARLCRFCPEGV